MKKSNFRITGMLLMLLAMFMSGCVLDPEATNPLDPTAPITLPPDNDPFDGDTYTYSTNFPASTLLSKYDYMIGNVVFTIPYIPASIDISGYCYNPTTHVTNYLPRMTGNEPPGTFPGWYYVVEQISNYYGPNTVTFNFYSSWIQETVISNGEYMPSATERVEFKIKITRSTNVI